MRRSVLALLALCMVPGIGIADEPRLSAEEIVEFFTRDAAGGEARTRGLSGTQPGEARDRSVHVGPSGFGDEEGEGEGGQPAAAPAALDLLVNFEFDSARLTDVARQNLDSFAEALRHPALAAARFAVEGHTDASGPAGYNLSLSQRRAAAVIDYLEGRGIDRDRLAAEGFGETRPRTDDPQNPGNRRVETRRLP